MISPLYLESLNVLTLNNLFMISSVVFQIIQHSGKTVEFLTNYCQALISSSSVMSFSVIHAILFLFFRKYPCCVAWLAKKFPEIFQFLFEYDDNHHDHDSLPLITLLNSSKESKSKLLSNIDMLQQQYLFFFFFLNFVELDFGNLHR